MNSQIMNSQVPKKVCKCSFFKDNNKLSENMPVGGPTFKLGKWDINHAKTAQQLCNWYNFPKR